MESRQIVDPNMVPVLVLAGNSTFTLVSKKTGTRFTYRINQVDEEVDGARKELWFVSVMNGTDNNSDYAYMGIITRSVAGVYSFRRTAKSRVSDMAPSYKAINWFLASALAPIARRTQLLAVLAQVEMWHEGRCCRCGRKLTVPESIASGLGPECAGRVGGRGFVAEAMETPRNVEDDERAMQEMEVRADREGTIRDEMNKHRARAAMEFVPYGHKTATGWSAKPLRQPKVEVKHDRPFDDPIDDLFAQEA